MAKGDTIIVAKMTHESNEYVGKRSATLYGEKDSDDAQLIADGNVGLTLRVQRSIREALKVKNGLKTITSGGEAKDLSSIEEV